MPDSLRPHEQRLIARVQDLLISDTADGWSLEQIAHEVGTSASTLQRQFKAAQGMSLFAWQRQRKLQQAFDALAARTLSIEEAAALAGYGSAANFATAFRRAFGSTPQQVRRFL
ncbi:AraC family transcriptional regulator [Halopseudomonas pachastrellae]|nr:AraC family transcriptional regulator [Halopseudomonas pachastrellae]